MKLFGTALVAAITLGAAFAQNASSTHPETTKKDIWVSSRHLKDQNMNVAPFGSGLIAESDETSYEGGFAIRVSTHNYFQGGILRFSAPVDLTTSYSDPNSMLQLAVRSADSVVVSGPAAGAAGNPGRGGGGEEDESGGPRSGASAAPSGPQAGGGAPGGGGRFGGGGGGRGGGFGAPNQQPGAQQPGTTTETITTALKTVRLIITTTDGKKSESYLALPLPRPKKPWREASIPLQSIAGFAKTNKTIESIAFSGDATTTFYVGSLKIVNDPTPISGEMNAKQDLNLALGDTVRFVGLGYGGSTVLKYTWDFDDTDGIQEDAVGAVVEHRFRKPGKYVVSLTIKDFYGLKAPFSTKVNVTVNP